MENKTLIKNFFHNQLNSIAGLFDEEILGAQTSVLFSDVAKKTGVIDNVTNYNIFSAVKSDYINATKLNILSDVLFKIDYSNLSTDELIQELESYLYHLSMVNRLILDVIVKCHTQCRQCNDMQYFNLHNIFETAENVELYNYLMSL